MSEISPLRFYLIPQKPVTVFSGLVDGTPSTPYMSIDWDSGATGTASAYGTSGAPIAGTTVSIGTKAGGSERGKIRLRNWIPAGGNPATGALSIAESSDIGPAIEDNDHLTIDLEFRLWPIRPRIVQSGGSVTYYEDYDITWTDQTVDWYPIAVAGPPGVAFMESTGAAISFVGNQSFALAPGATITSYLWTGHGSVEGTSALPGTTGAPVVFTWNQAGQYLVSLTVTDSNGKTNTAYTWAFVLNRDDPAPIGYDDFDNLSTTGDFDQGGAELTFTALDTADVSRIPKDSLIVLACDGTPVGESHTSWPFRGNVLFVGYLDGGGISQEPYRNTMTFNAKTVAGIMNATRMYPVTLTDKASPAAWVDAQDITIDRAVSFLAIWRSTLSKVASNVPLNYAAEIYRQDFGTGSLYDEMDGLLRDGWGRIVCNHQGVVHWLRDYQYMATGTERSGVPTGRDLTSADWLNAIDIQEVQDTAKQVAKVKYSGVAYAGSLVDVQPLFSDAPGDLLKDFGNESAKSAIVADTQANLNIRSGLELARGNMPYPAVRATFINDVSFDIAPQVQHNATIIATDNVRGLSWQPVLIPRRVRRNYNNKDGYFTAEIEFEPDASGPPGITVAMPETPPVPGGGGDPAIPSGTVTQVLTAASVNALQGESWGSLVTGTVHWLENDPFTVGRVLRGDPGSIHASVNYGETWADVSPGSGPTGTVSVSSLSFYQIQPLWDEADIWTTYGSYQNASGTWETYVAMASGTAVDWRWV